MKHAGKHRRTKQLNISDLKIREYVKKRGVKIEPVASKANAADTMTKPLPLEVFERHREKLGVRTSRMISRREGREWRGSPQSQARRVREETSPEADETGKDNVVEQSRGRRGIPVRFKKRARVKMKLERA
ncbi:hypothetical protein PHYSODRAFT_300582 [Phytophthora sojae]|uniref:Uncharacterized protein n=1 Tax=Phytophthora sojae (strain P6497) TaxID=1094619 RepID=G4ZG56_PHYSP|nr:hypothetical protein PHYSODRAFT_300582 [Phytophthora sojae]EGZ17540.1 hypothetical protein PHYSODRAFT_300582 [Phytophthora sojae]|eukprot:XP_009526598.1 hypothetical protein PHYSODRAFT_300582 [Phytophthora sojae]